MSYYYITFSIHLVDHLSLSIKLGRLIFCSNLTLIVWKVNEQVLVGRCEMSLEDASQHKILLW